jgi:hypothetical protein
MIRGKTKGIGLKEKMKTKAGGLQDRKGKNGFPGGGFVRPAVFR